MYLDEMGCAANMNLDSGRSRQGERLYDANPTAPGTTVNAVAALTETGVEAVWTFTGSLSAERFINYLQFYLLDILTGGRVLIMDNHPAHCAKTVVKFLDEHNVAYAYLPRYSPELNPIEEAFSKTKHAIRKIKPREHHDLVKTMHGVLKTITPDDVISFVNHSEYFMQVTC